MLNAVYIEAFGTKRESRTKFNNYPTDYRDFNIKLMNETFLPENLFKQIMWSIVLLSYYIWFQQWQIPSNEGQNSQLTN
jgi:hypothetical protein